MLTLNQFADLFPRADHKADIVLALNDAAPKYGIETLAHWEMLLAQLGHESAGFTRWVESFAYTPERLLAVYPSQFRDVEAAAAAVARGPEAIANHVYAGRLGNGDEASGDGWRFRGRGPIQLTGLGNYARFGKIISVNLLLEPDRAAQIGPGCAIACAYFWASGCLAVADDLRACTRRINGPAMLGLDDRRRRWLAAKLALSA